MPIPHQCGQDKISVDHNAEPPLLQLSLWNPVAESQIQEIGAGK